jgi:hypothetical protein
MKLRFTKMHGLGNDFVVLDGIAQRIAFDAGAVPAPLPTGVWAWAAIRC